MNVDYDMPLYRPPSEGDNLIIQATLGCSFNQCSFCSMYRQKQYTERSLELVFREIDAAAAAWPDTRRVFLADGDALALPTSQLVALLQRLSAALPRLGRVSCYATPGNLLRKRAEELELLRRHKLSLVYLGIESGSDLILKKITKGATQRGIAEALHKADGSGLKVSATVVLGLGGQGYWAEHVDGTLELLARAPVVYLSTLQLYLHPNQLEEFQLKFGERFASQDDLGILREQARLVAGLTPLRPVIFRSTHASNALALEGRLPSDRDRLLHQLNEAIEGTRPLRPDEARGL